MKRTTDESKIRKAIDQLKLDSHFSTKGLRFEILEYEKGEQIVSPLTPLNYFIFVLSGNVRIYQIREDSTIRAIVNLTAGKILGYHEFCFNSDKYTLYAEAQTPVKCLILPFRQTNKSLKDDSLFLMYLLKANLIDSVQQSEILQRQMDLKEQVLFYIQNICENNRLTSVNNAVDVLHCSRRSLQRVLKQMCDENLLVHSKKGCYQLSKDN